MCSQEFSPIVLSASVMFGSIGVMYMIFLLRQLTESKFYFAGLTELDYAQYIVLTGCVGVSTFISLTNSLLIIWYLYWRYPIWAKPEIQISLINCSVFLLIWSVLFTHPRWILRLIALYKWKK